MTFNISKTYQTGKAVLFMTLLMLMLLPSCAKAPINGKLDGLWEVKEITADGETRKPEERLFWKFQLHVCQLSDINEPFTNGNLSYDCSTVKVDFPYISSPESRERLREWGIYSNPVEFTVSSIDSDRLVLTDGNVTVRLLKF